MQTFCLATGRHQKNKTDQRVTDKIVNSQPIYKQPLLHMKTLICFLVFTSISILLTAQTVNLSFNNAPIEKVFKAIINQTNYNFIYTRDQLAEARPVSIQATAIQVAQALEICFKDQPLTYHLEDKYIIVKEKTKTQVGVTAPVNETVFIVTGQVLGDNGMPLAGTLVTAKAMNKIVACDDNGEFSIPGISAGTILSFTHVGYKAEMIKVMSDTKITVQLSPAVQTLDETLVIAYGNTTRRLNTGSVSKVASEEINNQPVTNVLQALHGRVAGLTVVQQNGIPGSAVKIQVRGRTSINSNINNDPLIIIDGVPFAPNNSPINQVGSALGNGGLSPLNSINPADIESIEVLKDADATAIYGSRGANGVVLITTKKGKVGKTKLDVNLRTGFSKTTRSLPFMNTQQYIEMRREAFANDGIVPNTTPGTAGFAPDLLLWDTTRYTDFRKLLIGGTARFTDMQMQISGGNTQTQFLLGTGYTQQTTVFPGDLHNNKASFHTSLNHQSADKKLNLMFKASYVHDNNNINISDLTSNLLLPPNLPSLYDSSGKLNWEHKGVSFDNPLAYVLREYESKTNNLLANTQVEYRFNKELVFRTSVGFNSVAVKDYSTTPIASQDPATAPLGNAVFGNNDFKSIIIEPQLQYKKRIGKGRLDMLAATTYQRNTKEGLIINGTGYNNDVLLHSLRGAANVTAGRNDFIIYKYAALFGRIHYSYADKYIINLTGRRDGSSRFGPGKQYSNFGAAGLAWLFTKEAFIKRLMPALHHGKLRMSYGLTGNDKIGDYAFLNTYSSTGVAYQGNPGITPTTLFNPDYAWEMNKKFEAAIETAFFNEKLRFNLAYFLNTSGNQLINYALPAQTGGQSIIANFPATVINKGWELELHATPIETKHIEWNTSFNITLPTNQLNSFPAFESSSYYSFLELGMPLNIVTGYRFAGVNTSTGVYEYIDKDGKPTSAPTAQDRIKGLVKLDPSFYGGFSNNVRLNQWELDVFLDFTKQMGQNYLGNLLSGFTYAGMMYNMPHQMLTRWQLPGNNTNIQRFTASTGSAAYQAASITSLNASDIQYGDASFIRMKNISLSYALPQAVLKRLRITSMKFSMQAQNLFTITGFEGADPETQNILTLPPMRTIVAGLHLTL